MVKCEQKGDSVRFWVKLPGLSHAEVKVQHDDKGNATLNLEAVPSDRALVCAALGFSFPDNPRVGD